MFKGIFFAIGTLAVVALAWPYLPFHAPYTVTVTGMAQGSVSNQVATFNATVTTSDNDKQKAIDTTNTKMTSLIDAVKNYGVNESEIKTGSISVYQNPGIYPMMQGSAPSGSGTAQTQVYPMPPIRVGNGGWTASNSITITLHDVSKAGGLADVLNASGATNVYGPNFTVDNTSDAQSTLLTQAIEDAKKKATNIAKANNQSIGKMVSVSEDNVGNVYPLYAKAAGAPGTTTPVEPGTTSLSKEVTVTFELK